LHARTHALTGLIWLALAAGVLANGGEKFPFHIGEKLTYQMFWGPFIVGRAVLEVAGIEAVDGHDCYHIVAQVRTSGIAEMLFPVRTKAESWLDVAGLFSRRYRQDHSENKRHRLDETLFDYKHNRLLNTNLLTGKAYQIGLNAPAQDVISALYFARTQPLALDAETSFLVNASKTNYTVSFCPDTRKKIWARATGDTPALRVEPKPTLPIVAANKGRMWVWVSDDFRRLPLLVVSDTKIGSAKLVLHQAEHTNPMFPGPAPSRRR
jgi:hypothetical protein